MYNFGHYLMVRINYDYQILFVKVRLLMTVSVNSVSQSVVHRLISECSTHFTSGLDMMIGAPLYENYRIARTEEAELASLDSLQAFLFGGGLKATLMPFTSNVDFGKILSDVKYPPVSHHRFNLVFHDTHFCQLWQI